MTLDLLRPGVLAGVDAWVAAPPTTAAPPPATTAVPGGDCSPPSLGRSSAVTVRLRDLGARTHRLEVDALGEQPAVTAPAAAGTAPGLPVLVWDGEAALAAAAPGVAGVHAALDGAWLAVRAVAAAVMHPDARGGKVVLLAPWTGDPHRAAARAGLENLSRTLGVEWARLGVRTVTLLPGPATDADAVAELVAYLASPAGDYVSGTAISLA